MKNDFIKKDVDLGGGVFVSWTSYEGERIGGILIHPKAENPNGECWGSFWFKNNLFLRKDNLSESEYNRPVWDFDGNFEQPTLAPSFMCHCGFHGWIEKGKWRNA